MYYPVLFEPIYKQIVWGGSRLAELFGRELPFDHVGESWDISCRPKEMGMVRNGRLRGTTFTQLCGINPEGWLGSAMCGLEKFPLLVKWIDANTDLSVQVHPSGDEAKNEVWYIHHAPECGTLGLGLKPGVCRDTFAAALDAGTVEDCLAFIPVKAGDVVNIPAGTVHALTKGAVVAEIQQNSDTTYRVYDYNRVNASGVPRPLHIPQALAVSDFSGTEHRPLQGKAQETDGGQIIFYCATAYYSLYAYRVDTCIRECSDPERFAIFTCIDGGCEIRAGGYCATVTAGDSVFIPAALGAYAIVGQARLLKALP